jgi:hypothetical protein
MGNEKFSAQSISSSTIKIQFVKWEQLLIIMQDKGYIKGPLVAKALEEIFVTL